jgi:hypothetical protein
MKTRHLLCGLALLATTGLTAAHDYKLGSIKIDHPWARATAAGQTAGGGYARFDNAGAADRLISATSAAAERVELHEMKMDGDVMRMRQLDGIDLPAGKSVELKPGGYHIMFIGLKKPLAEGSKFPLKLKFEKAGEVTVDVKVESATAAAMPGEHKH